MIQTQPLIFIDCVHVPRETEEAAVVPESAEAQGLPFMEVGRTKDKASLRGKE